MCSRMRHRLSRVSMCPPTVRGPGDVHERNGFHPGASHGRIRPRLSDANSQAGVGGTSGRVRSRAASRPGSELPHRRQHHSGHTRPTGRPTRGRGGGGGCRHGSADEGAGGGGRPRPRFRDRPQSGGFAACVVGTAGGRPTSQPHPPLDGCAGRRSRGARAETYVVRQQPPLLHCGSVFGGSRMAPPHRETLCGYGAARSGREAGCALREQNLRIPVCMDAAPHHLAQCPPPVAHHLPACASRGFYSAHAGADGGGSIGGVPAVVRAWRDRRGLR